jgi:RNA polymerase sigma factor (sigma-70 family)
MNMATLRPKPEAGTTRYSLLTRLHDWDDQEGWREFFELYWRLIYAAALKSGLQASEAQDVVQETVICVAKSIEKFRRDRSRGSFRGWLRNIIRWRIADYLKKHGRNASGNGDGIVDYYSENIDEIAADPETESIWQKEWQNHVFAVAVGRVKQKVKEEQYQMFDLYVMQQLPVREVAHRLRVTVGHVYVAKHRISSLIKKEMKLLESGLF